MDRLGLSYEQARQLNPSLIFCSVSGFGQTGPRARQPAYDAILQGMGGIQYLSGERDGGPTRVGVPIADISAGMFAAYAVAAALFWRERDPARRGQFVDTSMLGGQVALLTYQAGRYFATGTAPGRIGNRHASIAPYEMFKASDGYVNVAAANEPMWQRFCNALGPAGVALGSALRDQPGSGDQSRGAQRARSRRASRSLTMAEVIECLETAEVPVGAVYDLAQVFADPQSRAPGHVAAHAPSQGARLEDDRLPVPPLRNQPRRPLPAAASGRAHRRSPRRARLFGEEIEAFAWPEPRAATQMHGAAAGDLDGFQDGCLHGGVAGTVFRFRGVPASTPNETTPGMSQSVHCSSTRRWKRS